MEQKGQKPRYSLPFPGVRNQGGAAFARCAVFSLDNAHLPKGNVERKPNSCNLFKVIWVPLQHLSVKGYSGLGKIPYPFSP